MKKYMFLSLALTMTCLTAFAEEMKVRELTSLADDDLKEIMAGGHPDIAVKFGEHTLLPITFYLKGDLATLAENDQKWGTIELQQTFYAKCIGPGDIRLSSNLTDWKPALEFITGTASIALNIHNGEPSLVVGTETNRRL